MSRIVVMHAGANKTKRWGGFRAPIFSNGSFIFMQFPTAEGHVHDPEPPTYNQLGWGPYVRPEILNRRVHLDPNFGAISTYGHARRPGDEVIFGLKGGAGHLFFMASLHFDKSRGEDQLSWINPHWGVYLIGGFRVKHVLTQSEFSTADLDVRQTFRENPHYTRRDSEPIAHVWISGSEGGLLNVAVPLSDPIEPCKPNEFTKAVFRTTTGKKITENVPFYHLVLLCEENAEEFWKEVSSKNPNAREWVNPVRK